MSGKSSRGALRTLHILGAASIGTYVYSPWSDLEWFALLNQAVVIPILSISGVWMWKGHRIKSALKKGT